MEVYYEPEILTPNKLERYFERKKSRVASISSRGKEASQERVSLSQHNDQLRNLDSKIEQIINDRLARHSVQKQKLRQSLSGISQKFNHFFYNSAGATPKNGDLDQRPMEAAIHAFDQNDCTTSILTPSSHRGEMLRSQESDSKPSASNRSQNSKYRRLFQNCRETIAEKNQATNTVSTCQDVLQQILGDRVRSRSRSNEKKNQPQANSIFKDGGTDTQAEDNPTPLKMTPKQRQIRESAIDNSFTFDIRKQMFSRLSNPNHSRSIALPAENVPLEQAQLNNSHFSGV